MTVAAILLEIIVNFIIYLSFGLFVTTRKGQKVRTGLTLLVGFFTYYGMFFMACVPVMKFYRPLILLTRIWVPVVVVVVLASMIFYRRQVYLMLTEITKRVKDHPFVCLFLVLIVGLQIYIVTSSYNFTLDASFYVASVSTNVETNMINVYDPFTGAWQDHFEMRYFFATYQVADAVVCQLTGIAPLVQTKSVMAAIVILLTNLVYYLIAGELFEQKPKEKTLMMGFMLLMNLLFVSIYTSSAFLLTRTYEGKAIVGNLSIMTVLYLFILYVKHKDDQLFWLYLFICCFGSTTVSSSANMLIPGELSVFFLPEIVISRRFKNLIPYVVCMIPGIVLALTFVAYVKGYFVFYTYPVW